MSKLCPTILCSFDPPENNWRCCPCRVQLGYCTTASSSKEGQNLTIHLLCVNLKVEKLELLWLGGQFFHKCPFRIDVVFLWHSIFINDGLDLIEPRRNRKRVKRFIKYGGANENYVRRNQVSRYSWSNSQQRRSKKGCEFYLFLLVFRSEMYINAKISST